MAKLAIAFFIIAVIIVRSTKADDDDERDDEDVNRNPDQLTALLYDFENQHHHGNGNFNRSERHGSYHRHHTECGFKCADGSGCLKSNNRCDSTIQCLDASDEIGCKCVELIDSKKICDGLEDCPMGEDEENCSPGCQLDEFGCSGTNHRDNANSKCIKISQRCDGHADCLPSALDEDGCFRLTAFDITIRGVLSEGYLQKRIGSQWAAICKSYGKTEELLAKKYAKKVCEITVGEMDEEPEISLGSTHDIIIHPELAAIEPLIYSKLVDKESKFTTTTKCNSGQIYRITCPDPKCGWPADRSNQHFVAHYTQPQHNFQTSAEHYIYRRASNPHGLTAKIVGGHDSSSGNWPFMVGIYRNGTFHCGGSLVNKQWILSAAHCFHGYEKYVFEAQVGMIRRNSFSPREQTRQVIEIHVHERYDSKIFFNDITLMKVDSPFFLSKWVTTACFPLDVSQDPKAGEECKVIGWGDLSEDGNGPDNLQEVSLPVLDKCLETFTKDTHQICAAVLSGGQDACQGDSGGPLICTEADGRHMVNGLVSFGRGCARPNQAGVYTRISAYVSWIEGVINGENLFTKLQQPPKSCESKCFRDGGECLFSKYSCDSHVHCLGVDDELNCEYTSRAASSYDDADEDAYEHIRQTSHVTVEHVHEYGDSKTKLCGPTEFQCKTSLSCVPLTLKCDGIPHCMDQTDEKHCECGEIIQNSYPEYTCDGFEHCLDGTDEIDCQSKTCDGKSGMVQCPNSKICISESSWCDGVNDCPYASDEVDCMRLMKSKGKIPSHIGFLEDKISRGLNQGYVITRHNGRTWKKACVGDFEGHVNDIVCQYLGMSNSEGTLSRKTRSAWGEELWRRRRDAHHAHGECYQVKVHCGESKCGQQKLYSLATQNPSSTRIGAHPWIANVFVEGKLSCSGTLVHKNWILVSSQCIDSHIRSTEYEYLSAIIGFTKVSHLATSKMEQIKRINSIVKLSDGMSLLRLESSFASDHFTTPICIESGYSTYNYQKDKPMCVRIKVVNGTIFEKPAVYEESCDDKGYQCIKLNSHRCKYISDYFVFCSTEGKTWFLHGYADAETVLKCSMDGKLQLKNPFYGPNGLATKDIFNQPVSTIISPPSCSGTRCSNGICVANPYVCDGITNCPDGLDERRCQRLFQRMLRSHDEDDAYNHDQFSHQNVSNVITKCPVGHFKCKVTGNCVPISAFCDDIYDCGYDDPSDEPDRSLCTCRHYLEMAAPDTLCNANGEVTCPDRGDEIDCPCDGTHSFACNPDSPRSKGCIHNHLVCDSVEDCENGRDEKFCTMVSSSLTHIRINGTSRSLEGYVLVRVKGSWHPYCTNQWSLQFGQNICKIFGFTTLVQLSTYELNELEYNQENNGYGPSSTEDNYGNSGKLWLLAKSLQYQVMEPGPLDNIIMETSGEEFSCTVARIQCSK